ncbi:hypothetical protein LTR10_005333 [Elasticomyces elasticus]|nr:hypothetical protein LTR10_005333 [Elasticomyces elasticus]KAK4976070.1 hypothetical protein LTR42_003695 [Elasticomyces elasticus]
MYHLPYFFGLLLTFCPRVPSKATRGNSVLLSQVKTLTLRADSETSHRRVEPLPQLSCVGGNAQGLYDVDVMRCKNAGSDYDTEDIQWTCSASLPPEFKLGSTDVICEGYESPEDPYVLKGSCGVEYRLVLTEQGERKYGRNTFERVYKKPTGQNAANALFTLLFWGVFVAVIGIFIYKTCISPTPNGGPDGNDRRLGWNGGGGGGGPDDDRGDNDNPPPYTPRAPKPRSDYQANSGGPSAQAGGRANGQWRPGFWTGAAAGAAANYAGSALGNAMNPNRGNRNRGYGGYDQPQPQAGPSSWFGGNREPDPPRRYGGGSMFGGGGAGPSGYGGGAGPSRSSAPAPSSSRQESTGFGSTRRR